MIGQAGYTFLHLGGVYEAIVSAIGEAHRRFGDRAMQCMHEAVYSDAKTPEELAVAVLSEQGVGLDAEGLRFLSAVRIAASAIDAARKTLEEVCRG